LLLLLRLLVLLAFVVLVVYDVLLLLLPLVMFLFGCVDVRAVVGVVVVGV